MKNIFLFAFLFISFFSRATTITGNVKSSSGNILPHASLLIKNTTIGTTANDKGVYNINLEKGKYTISCQYIGYKMEEKQIEVGGDKMQLDFILIEQNYKMQGVEVGTNREDPAYEIIRNAIKTREEHLYEVKKYETDVYVKSQLQLRDFPKRFFGQTIDFEDGEDSSKRKMIFLSETVAKYYYNGKDERKIEVISTRVSGDRDGFGMASPQIISFYENIISVGRGLNPRGFVSPINNNALHYYKYKFMGSFYENGKEISRIKVTPKRGYEPLFTGFINIIENEWRIYSADLSCLKAQQLELLDTLNIQQIYNNNNGKWVIKQQVIKPAGKILGFDFFGTTVQVYKNFNVNPTFTKATFDDVLLKFTDSSNKKPKQYWDSVRPIPLNQAEARDYVKKDSLEIAHEDPKYLDSVDKKNNKLTVGSVLFWGKSFSNRKKESSIYIEPLLTNMLQYNTVEGLVGNLSVHYNKTFKNKDFMAINPAIRYGFSNTHFNPSINFYYRPKSKYFTSYNFKLGSNVFQFDNNNPVNVLANTLSTLYWQNNPLKMYEAKFFKFDYNKDFAKGFYVHGHVDYQDRKPLENTTDYTWRKIDGRSFSPNFPKSFTQITEHKALSVRADIYWQPGVKYIEYPDNKQRLRSKYPTFIFSYTQGIPSVLGSNVDYGKWGFSITDNLNLKLGGRLDYRFKIAGFTYNNFGSIPDMHHIIGNENSVASSYLNSFQLLPLYALNNSDKMYLQGHIEYHLNGLLSNKIPLIKKWNLHFVLGANVFYNNDKKFGYYEGLAGIENIFKIMRVDFVQSFDNNITGSRSGVKFSIPILFN